MRERASSGMGSWAGTAAVVATALLVSACSSTGGGGSATGERVTFADRVFGSGGPTRNTSTLDPSVFAAGFCPPIEIRPGTESLRVYAGADETPQNVRYQANIGRTARECRRTGDVLNLRVGIAGRALAGPKGGAGPVNLPVRVAVVGADDRVLFSELRRYQVNLQPPQLGADFAEVVEVAVTAGMDDNDLRIYVGYDDGGR